MCNNRNDEGPYIVHSSFMLLCVAFLVALLSGRLQKKTRNSKHRTIQLYREGFSTFKWPLKLIRGSHGVCRGLSDLWAYNLAGHDSGFPWTIIWSFLGGHIGPFWGLCGLPWMSIRPTPFFSSGRPPFSLHARHWLIHMDLACVVCVTVSVKGLCSRTTDLPCHGT